MRELEAQAKALAPIMTGIVAGVRDELRKEFAGQLQSRDDRIAELQKALDERPDLEAIAKQAAALIPAPENGKDADPEVIKQMVSDAVAGMHASETGEHIRPMLADLVAEAVNALPAPAPGKDADMDEVKRHVEQMVKGIEPAPVPTVDEVAATFERRFSDLALSWERQARDTFDKAADRMPAPKDGRDALPLDSFDLTLGDDGRTVTVKMQAGDTVIEKSVKIAAVVDRGVFSKDHDGYEKGDGTTYGGCFWIAQKDAPEGVPGGSADWRMAVKKGRDGKDLRPSASTHDPDKGVKLK
tara:strand:+ start:10475 stop:11371 length:897 start_codon:yes stop_codon:yes gene_type:complete